MKENKEKMGVRTKKRMEELKKIMKWIRLKEFEKDT